MPQLKHQLSSQINYIFNDGYKFWLLCNFLLNGIFFEQLLLKQCKSQVYVRGVVAIVLPVNVSWKAFAALV